MRFVIGRTQSRLLAIGLLVALIALLAVGVAWPTLALHKRYDVITEDSLDRLARYRRVASIRPAIEASISAVEQREAHKSYWKGQTPALLAADVQGRVTRIIESNGGRITTSQTLPNPDDSKSGGPPKVSIAVQMTASTVPLQLILHAIENNSPYLFVDQLSIRSSLGRGYKPTPGVQPEFMIGLTVRGYGLAFGEPK
jgi:general secretion pathway protein M